MEYNIHHATDLLGRTPDLLETLLLGLPEELLKTNEGNNTWSPYDVIGHLIHGEKTDWIPRAKIILSDLENKTFTPFDRFAQMNKSSEPSIQELLTEFRSLRKENISTLKSWNLSEDDFNKTGIHPELGVSRLKELLSTWIVHDLGHLAQISRVMAKQYKDEVGPWKQYLGILK